MLDYLTAHTIDSVVEIHDYFQLVFSDESRLGIFNQYTLKDCTLQSIQGQQIKSVSDTDEKVIFVFSEGGVLTIGLRDEHFTGPEAIQLDRPGHPTVIWN